jgi:acyl carrier protein
MMDHFYEKLEGILEADGLGRESAVADIENWDSLGVLAVLAMIDSTYKATVTSEELAKVIKLGDLEDIVAAKAAKR